MAPWAAARRSPAAQAGDGGRGRGDLQEVAAGDHAPAFHRTPFQPGGGPQRAQSRKSYHTTTCSPGFPAT